MKRILVCLIAAAFAAAGCGQSTGGSTPHNVILYIGDGMGVSHLTAARVAADTLHMARLTVGGLQATHPVGAFVTDSAASGTALATGVKTTNGRISVTPDGDVLKTAAEWADEAGKATGVVVTCSVTHATPAVFLAHVDDRGNQSEIARQLAAGGADVLFGGGWGYFVPSGFEGSLRPDNTDAMAMLSERMSVVATIEGLRELEDVDAAAALLANGHLPVAPERSCTLAELTRKAIDILSRDPDGFFLMVEGSQIDWAGHENMAGWVIDETIDFDAAVGAGMDFAERDGRTLVVVTADHETGGFAVHDGSVAGRGVSETAFTSIHHTGSLVPVLAYGPGSEAFGGIYENTFIGRTLISYMGGPAVEPGARR